MQINNEVSKNIWGNNTKTISNNTQNTEKSREEIKFEEILNEVSSLNFNVLPKHMESPAASLNLSNYIIYTIHSTSSSNKFLGYSVDSNGYMGEDFNKAAGLPDGYKVKKEIVGAVQAYWTEGLAGAPAAKFKNFDIAGTFKKNFEHFSLAFKDAFNPDKRLSLDEIDSTNKMAIMDDKNNITGFISEEEYRNIMNRTDKTYVYLKAKPSGISKEEIEKYMDIDIDPYDKEYKERDKGYIPRIISNMMPETRLNALKDGMINDTLSINDIFSIYMTTGIDVDGEPNNDDYLTANDLSGYSNSQNMDNLYINFNDILNGDIDILSHLKKIGSGANSDEFDFITKSLETLKKAQEEFIEQRSDFLQYQNESKMQVQKDKEKNDFLNRLLSI